MISQSQLEALIRGLAQRPFTSDEVHDAIGPNTALQAIWDDIYALAEGQGWINRTAHRKGKRGRIIFTYSLTEKGRDYARLIAKGAT